MKCPDASRLVAAAGCRPMVSLARLRLYAGMAINVSGVAILLSEIFRPFAAIA